MPRQTNEAFSSLPQVSKELKYDALLARSASEKVVDLGDFGQ
jgi:hypothetical protein